MALPRSTHPIPAYYSFIDPERMKGWVGLVGWFVADGLVYPHYWSPISCRSTGRAQYRESSPARDWRSTTMLRHQPVSWFKFNKKFNTNEVVVKCLWTADQTLTSKWFLGGTTETTNKLQQQKICCVYNVIGMYHNKKELFSISAVLQTRVKLTMNMEWCHIQKSLKY